MIDDFDEIIEFIQNKKILDLDKIDAISSHIIDEKIANDEEFLLEFRKKLVLQSFIAKNALLNTISADLYTLCFDYKYLEFHFFPLLLFRFYQIYEVFSLQISKYS